MARVCLSFGSATALLHKHVWNNYGHSAMVFFKWVYEDDEERGAGGDRGLSWQRLKMCRRGPRKTAWFHFKPSGRGSVLWSRCAESGVCVCACIRWSQLHDQIFQLSCRMCVFQKTCWLDLMLVADSFTATARDRWAVCKTYARDTEIY